MQGVKKLTSGIVTTFLLFLAAEVLAAVPPDDLPAIRQLCESLKHEGRWEDNLVLAREGIMQSREEKRPEKELALSLQAVSSAFYLGDYKEARTLAERANELARQLKNERAEIESLYLLSGVARGEKRDTAALAYAERALTKCQQELKPGDRLEGKVRFNLGAALTDAEKPDLERGIEELEQARDIFAAAENRSDLLRVNLRLVRAYLLQEQPFRAEAALMVTKDLVDSPRNGMLYLLLRARTSLARGRLEEAKEAADYASVVARKLNAEKDLERIMELQEEIARKTES